ncbi:hypothetical protein COO60DRAFT_382964 [Scenedesmus sp. NREL 46B-D3]|nr:hypothetical protein COO60DRAFT_382964 [Scenedesmus sp. NREL 46B-D3]
MQRTCLVSRHPATTACAWQPRMSSRSRSSCAWMCGSRWRDHHSVKQYEGTVYASGVIRSVVVCPGAWSPAALYMYTFPSSVGHRLPAEVHCGRVHRLQPVFCSCILQAAPQYSELQPGCQCLCSRFSCSFCFRWQHFVCCQNAATHIIACLFMLECFFFFFTLFAGSAGAQAGCIKQHNSAFRALPGRNFGLWAAGMAFDHIAGFPRSCSG